MKFPKIDKKEFLEKLKYKYKVVLFDAHNYEEVWSGSGTRLVILVYVGSFVVIWSFILILFIIYTPLNRLLPAYSSSDMQRQIVSTAMKVDSLEHQIVIRDQYFDNLKSIINGKEPNNYESKLDTSKKKYGNIKFKKTTNDSMLRKQIEEEEDFNLSKVEQSKTSKNFSQLHFFAPAKGMPTNQFSIEQKHFGIDIVSSPNEPILATLDGTVISSSWTLSMGYVIQIQHENNMVSIYAHNAALLKEIGDHVKAGAAIAIMGNTGELTTGPHLHFELWHNGVPLDPRNYITF
jgi:murein DD-endopeptidase MepM/ murein hydrolase activator NlpD